MTWALDGRLSGSGPVHPSERAAMIDAGWQPFSLRVGNKWHSYQRFDPFARVLSTAADFVTFSDYMTEKERENIAQTMAIALARNVSTMPTLDPAASAFEALSDPDRHLFRYIKNLGASVAVPNVVTQINSTLDPYMRETDTLLATIKSRVPGMSDQLPVRMNLWGQSIERGDSFGPDLVSPVWVKRVSGDKTLREVSRLRLSLDKLDRVIGGKRLTSEQYARFVYTAGKPAKAYLDALTATPEWDSMPDGMKRLTIKKAVSEFRKTAKSRLLSAYPELEQANAEANERRRTGER